MWPVVTEIAHADAVQSINQRCTADWPGVSCGLVAGQVDPYSTDTTVSVTSYTP